MTGTLVPVAAVGRHSHGFFEIAERNPRDDSTQIDGFSFRREQRHRVRIAVRIVDTSMRTRQADFTPSASPGVNVAGVGATSLARPGDLPKEPSGCLLELIASFKRLISRVLK